MAKAGDRVKLVTKDDAIEGVLMPDEKDFYVVKLDTGYNIGVDKKRVKDVKVLEAHQEALPSAKEVAHKQGLPTISILHTGGTIASKVDYETGAVTNRFTPDEILALFPELREIANIESRLIRNMASDDMRFAHYNLLANEAAKEVAKGVQGVIITHGTDTMHYSAAALSFALRNLPIPVLLVGAQRSSDRGSSDAGANLIAAAAFIAGTDFAGVGVCMHETTNDTTCIILPGTKCRKLHSARRDAFRPVNAVPWARVDFKHRKVEWLRTDYPRRNGTFGVKPFKENLKVGLLHIHTQMYAEQFTCYKDWHGLVLAGTGLGHIPMSVIDAETKEHERILNAVKRLIDSGTVVAMSTQTLFGQVDMNVYAPGRKLQETGVIGNLTDMHPETAFIKLAWLLSNYPKDEAKALYTTNIAGEISERIEPGAFLWH